MLSHRRRFSLYAIVAALVLLTGCGGGGNSAGPEVKYCADGSVAPGNDISRCAVVPPPETVSVSVSASTSFVGVAYPMSKVTISASGQSTTGMTVTVSVTVDGSPSAAGSITLPEGNHTICGTATSSSGVKSSEACQILTITWPKITGRFVAATPAGEYVPQNSWAVVEDVDSVRVNADGTFNIHTLSALKDTTKVVIRGSSDVFPTLARVERKYFGNYVQVSSARNWTIPTGTYAGQTIALSMEKAYKETPPQPTGFFPRWQRPGENNAYRYTVGSYITFPVKLAAYTGRSSFTLSAADEAMLWAIVTEMNTALGFNGFVQSDTTSVNAGGGIRMVFNPGGNGGVANETKGDYTFGSVTIGQSTEGILIYPSDGSVKHELMHASGSVAHTCQWSSLMEQNCLRNQPDDLTPEDVAYWHLMRLVRGLERKYDTRFSMAQTHQGERVFLLGLLEEKVIVFGIDGYFWP